jgi:hypothetical protein
MVTGAGPQANVMTPPAATAATTASEVQLPGVPVPTTRVGWLVSAACASAGIAAWPSGFPVGEGLGPADTTGAALVRVADAGAAAGRAGVEQPASQRGTAARRAIREGDRTRRL